TLFISLTFLGVLIIGYVMYQYVYATRTLDSILTSVTSSFQATVRQLDQRLVEMREENDTLLTALGAEKNRNNIFDAQIKSMQSTVSTLEKLSKTDKELLMKYSRVYFLNENYVPSNLSIIDKKYNYNQDELLQIHTNVEPFLYKLLEAAASSSVPMEIISAYRSFGTQAVLKSGYKIIYGSGANQFSADQGYSEHQLGTTIDLTTSDIDASFSKFEASTAYKWLVENAYRYGFILSYPKQNKYYQFEPWHWRFVGIGLATKLHNNNQYFYDLDQREIDAYLVTIFD
ncbi:MAG: hypothetical protein COZ64_02505, partial [Candidatus Brennerbacteria bacterium CG_4_8_14_3_um_filter_43_14]